MLLSLLIERYCISTLGSGKSWSASSASTASAVDAWPLGGLAEHRVAEFFVEDRAQLLG